LAWAEEHPGRYRIEGKIREGDEIFVSMNFDPGWSATQDGAAIGTKRNLMGMLQVEPKPKAASVVVLEYRGTNQQKIFAGLSVLVWIGSITLWRRAKNAST
jgi:uncharacterized membrane protein YfhO